jgi:N-methylhydantoinase A
MVNMRLALIGKRPKLRFPRLRSGRASKACARRPVYIGRTDKPVSCPIYARAQLPAGARLGGPALIEEHGTTTVLYSRDACRVAPSGELIIAVRGAA